MGKGANVVISGLIAMEETKVGPVINKSAKSSGTVGLDDKIRDELHPV